MNAATVYMDLLRDGALLELQRRNVEVLQEQLRQTRDRFIVGEVTRTDVAQAESRLAAGRASVLSAEAQYARSRATYRQVIGVEPGTLAPGAPIDRLSPSRLPVAVEIARARHPSVGVAMFGIDFAVLQVKISEGSLYPHGDSHRHRAAAVGNRPHQAGVAAVQRLRARPAQRADLPGRHRILADSPGQGDGRAEANRSRYRARRRPGERDHGVGTIGGGEGADSRYAGAGGGAEIALNGVREEARVGQRTTLDVLNAQQELVNARTALVTAQHDRVVASYNLLAGVGELNLPKLGLNIPLYDPMVHYEQVRDAWAGVRIPDGR